MPTMEFIVGPDRDGPDLLDVIELLEKTSAKFTAAAAANDLPAMLEVSGPGSMAFDGLVSLIVKIRDDQKLLGTYMASPTEAILSKPHMRIVKDADMADFNAVRSMPFGKAVLPTGKPVTRETYVKALMKTKHSSRHFAGWRVEGGKHFMIACSPDNGRPESISEIEIGAVCAEAREIHRAIS